MAGCSSMTQQQLIEQHALFVKQKAEKKLTQANKNYDLALAKLEKANYQFSIADTNLSHANDIMTIADSYNDCIMNNGDGICVNDLTTNDINNTQKQ